MRRFTRAERKENGERLRLLAAGLCPCQTAQHESEIRPRQHSIIAPNARLNSTDQT